MRKWTAPIAVLALICSYPVREQIQKARGKFKTSLCNQYVELSHWTDSSFVAKTMAPIAAVCEKCELASGNYS